VNGNKHWLQRPGTIRWLWRAGLGLLALLVAGDLLIDTHPRFAIEGSFAFFAWFGFGACVVMVLFARALGVLIKRDDTYYDD
jgi:hypothetical protein